MTDRALETSIWALKRLGFKSGLANCHVPGLYSLVIADRADSTIGMLRIFYASRTCSALTDFIKPTDDGSFEFSLLPHNHRQAITLYRLFGNPLNWGIEAKEDGPAFEWEFGSALLDGQFSLSRKRSVQLDVMEKPISRRGIAMPAESIHTVTADPGSAWLVDEGALSGALTTRCYSLLSGVSLSNEGLYIPLNQEDLAVLAKEILDQIEDLQ